MAEEGIGFKTAVYGFLLFMAIMLCCIITLIHQGVLHPHFPDRSAESDVDEKRKSLSEDFSELQVRLQGRSKEDIANWCRLHKEDQGLGMMDEEPIRTVSISSDNAPSRDSVPSINKWYALNKDKR